MFIERTLVATHTCPRRMAASRSLSPTYSFSPVACDTAYNCPTAIASTAATATTNICRRTVCPAIKSHTTSLQPGGQPCFGVAGLAEHDAAEQPSHGEGLSGDGE